MSSCTTLPLTRDTFYLFSPPEENSVKIKIVLGKALIPCPRTIANIPESAIKPTIGIYHRVKSRMTSCHVLLRPCILEVCGGKIASVLRGEQIVIFVRTLSSSNSFLVFVPDRARKKTGIDKLVSVSDLRENCPTGVIRRRRITSDCRLGLWRKGLSYLSELYVVGTASHDVTLFDE